MDSKTQLLDGTRVQIEMNNLLERTERQFSMLGRMLGAVSELTKDNKALSEGTEAPAEVKKKAADSTERILHQIDNIVEDMARWGNNASVLEKHYDELIKATVEVQKAAAFEAQVKCLPSSRHQVHLHEYAKGRWGAYLVQSGEARLMGSGTSPQGALADFDQTFIEGEKTRGKKARRAIKKAPKLNNGSKNNQSAGPA